MSPLRMPIIPSASSVFFALSGGILPALFWLWFWLKEDSLHPEPRQLIMIAFLIGMCATVISYPLEHAVNLILPELSVQKFFIWAIIEEFLKWAGIMLLLFNIREFDEPIDAVIYTVTGALGFAALENALFLLSPLESGNHLWALRIDNFRFIGATLLHVASSSIPGLIIAHTFFRKKTLLIYGFYGLFLAILLHAAFNVSIMMREGEFIYLVFISLWGVVLGILYACEKVKRMHPDHEDPDSPEAFPSFRIKLSPR